MPGIELVDVTVHTDGVWLDEWGVFGEPLALVEIAHHGGVAVSAHAMIQGRLARSVVLYRRDVLAALHGRVSADAIPKLKGALEQLARQQGVPVNELTWKPRGG